MTYENLGNHSKEKPNKKNQINALMLKSNKKKKRRRNVSVYV